MSPIKIYLSILNLDDSWENIVYRDFQTLKLAWDKSIKNNNKKAVILHVGYSKPDYNIKDFLDNFSENFTPVLLTDSAKWALPSVYSYCSKKPISSCKIQDREEKCNLFMSLSKWGYEFYEDKELNKYSLSNNLNFNNKIVSEWIEIVKSQNIDLFSYLTDVGIFSESDYIIKYHLINKSQLDAIDKVRFDYYKNRINIDNPLNVLKYSPNWLLDSPVTKINPSVRILNVFKLNNISFIRDILNFSLDSFLSLPNFGKKSLRDLSKLILSAIEEYYNPDSIFGKKLDDNSLKMHLEKGLEKLPDLPKTIIKSRLGINNEIPLTLQQLAEIYGITRERVRQIEKKYINKIIEVESWDNLMIEKIEILLKSRDTPLFIELLEVEDKWFSGFSNELDYFAQVIERFSENKINILTLNGSKIVSKINQESLENLIKNIERELSDNCRSGWSKATISELIKNKCIGYGVLELSNYIDDYLSENLNFAEINGNDIFVSIGRSTEDLVMVILEQTDLPLHYTDISNRVSEIANKSVDVRRVQSCLVNLKEAKLFARGVYGLKKHLSFNKNEINHIKQLSEEIISSNKTKQWHITEVLESLQNSDIDLPDNIDTYNLAIILGESDNIIYLGRQIWVSKSDNQESKIDRIHTTDILISILEEEGKPLSSEDLINKASIYRGVKKATQIKGTEVLIKVSPNTWGLSYRDIPLSKEERALGLNTIFEFLNKSNKSIHLTELNNLFKDNKIIFKKECDPYVFLSLCSLDTRFKLWHGYLIGLSSWEGPNRETILSAFEIVFESISTPTSLEDIKSRVENIVGRSIDKNKISALLSSKGGHYDKSSALWSNPKVLNDSKNNEESLIDDLAMNIAKYSWSL